LLTAAKPNQGRFADKKVIPTLALPLTRDKETVSNSLPALSGATLPPILMNENHNDYGKNNESTIHISSRL